MMDFDDTNTNIISLNLPLKDSQGYAGLFLRYFSTLGALVCDTKSDADYRIHMFTDLMISAIPEPKTRDALRQLKKQLIKEKLEEVNSDDLDEKHKVVISACMDVVGEISGYMDTYLGASKKIGVSIEAVYPEEHYQVDEKGV